MTKGWKRDRYEHGLASKGVQSRPPMISVDERSGVWFESQGMIGEMVSLMQMIGFDELLAKKEAKGYTRTTYEADASRIAILPTSKAKQSVEWLNKEWKTAPRPRKNKLLNLVRMAKKRISMELNKVAPSVTKVQLHESRKLYTDFLAIRGG